MPCASARAAAGVAHLGSAPNSCRCSPAVRRARQQRHAQAHRRVVLAATATDQLPELTQQLRDIIQSDGVATTFPPDALPVLQQIDSVAQETGAPEVMH